ncbi:MAG: hypothetical protein ABI183_08545 [Polyangiaceae bacterium]
MKRHPWRIVACSTVAVLLIACADEDAQNAPAAAPTAVPTTYVTNNTYNNVVNYNAPTASSASAGNAPAPMTFMQGPDAGGISPRNASHGGTPRDLATTGVPECDAYLARVESCSRGLLSGVSQSDALDRITASLDTARRAWRHAALNSSERPSLASTCNDALTQYDASVTNVVCK